MIKVVFTMKLPHLLFICTSLLCSLPLYGLDGWMTDMEKAKLQAAEQHKDLLIVYKGSSWNPEAYGVPECLFASDLFKKAAQSRFILVEQDYPEDYSMPTYFPTLNTTDPTATKPGELPVKFSSSIPEKATLCVLSTPSGVIYKSFPTKLLTDADAFVQELKKPHGRKIMELSQQIPLAGGDEKYRLMGKLSKLLPVWSTACQLSPLYRQWYQDAILHDQNNYSDILFNPVAEMTKFCWEGLWMAKGAAFLATHLNDDPFPEELRTNISGENYRKWKFLQILFPALLKSMSSPSLENVLTEARSKLDVIEVQEPSAFQTSQRRRELFNSIRIMYHLGKINALRDQPDEAIKQLNNLGNQSWMELPERQLFQVCRAGCHLKKGELDVGLEMLKSARDMAPWTTHAKHAHDDFLRISGNRDMLNTRWKQYQNGDEEAGAVYRKNILLKLNPVALELKIQ